jgi:uncharacterized protein YecE (DUF72 family)
MLLRVGTSGFSYKEWKGSFYPEDLKDDEMLGYYAERLNAVEINNTFYRMPKASVLEGWKSKVPEPFVFALKAPRRITHQAKLEDTGDRVEYLFRQAGALGPCLGPVLVQLPPYLKKDADLLRRFLLTVPSGPRIAVEFRSSSWYGDDIYQLLRDRNVALCVADFEDPEKRAPLVTTADFGYFRLRDSGYSDDALRSWVAQMRKESFREVFVFFKHEDEGQAPALALRFAALFSGGP